MNTATEAKVLALWEMAAPRSTLTRALILAAQGTALTGVADLGVGGRDSRLLELRRECFGTRLECVVDCPECAAELELDVAIENLEIPGPGRDCGSVRVDGVDIAFRTVTSRDLAAVSGAADARRTLIERCVTAGPARMTEGMLDAVSQGLAALDPQAAVGVEIDCAICAHHWAAPVDIAAFLWSELAACAIRTMRDVHELATAYGWSEAEVLSVSPLRRHHYLELVEP